MKSKLVCIVVVELVRPGVHIDTLMQWREQRDQGRELRPDPGDRIRVWKGLPEEKDWDRLIAFKRRDGWGNLYHGREFVTVNEERSDAVNLT